jgi:hypothetical protein
MADISERLEVLIQTIQNISSLGASFVYDVGKLLQSFGYELQDGDDWLLGFCIQKVENSIKNECNVSSVPCGLKKVASQMVVGEFLFAKKGIGQLQGLEIDIDAAVKQIQEGDTNVTFAFGNGCNHSLCKIQGSVQFWSVHVWFPFYRNFNHTGFTNVFIFPCSQRLDFPK